MQGWLDAVKAGTMTVADVLETGVEKPEDEGDAEDQGDAEA
jgi:Mg2+/Co2+ transporter CorC